MILNNKVVWQNKVLATPLLRSKKSNSSTDFVAFATVIAKNCFFCSICSICSICYHLSRTFFTVHVPINCIFS